MNLFDIAFQLLKEERRWITPLPSEANPNPEPMTTEEYEAHEEQRKEEMRARAAAGEWQLRDADGNLHPDYVDCPTCNGQGFRDEYSGDPEHGGETCYHCYGQGVVHRTEEENRPIDDLMRDMVNDPTKENQEAVRDYFVPQPDMEYDDDFQEKLAGEPMDMAWRLLKEEDWERYGFERSPWSALNPAPINTYDEEIEALGNAGDTAQARRFISVKNALAQPDAIRQSAIERFGIPISQAIAPEWDDDEHMASAVEFYNRGRNTSDFEDIKNYSPEQQAIMRASMKKLLAQKKRVGQYQERAEELENQLRIDDPTKFFADKRRPFRDPSSQPKPRNRFFNEPNVRPGDTVI